MSTAGEADSGKGRIGPIPNHVGDDQGGGEEDQAEQEVQNEAVALPASHSRRPEGDCYPNDEADDPPKHLDLPCSAMLPTGLRRQWHRIRCRTGTMAARMLTSREQPVPGVTA